MPITQHVDNDTHTLVTQMTGVITNKDIQDYMENMVHDVSSMSGLYQMLDMRDADLEQLSVFELENLAKFYNSHAERMPVRLALLVESSYTAFVAGLFKSMCDDTRKVKLFDDQRIAKKWLFIPLAIAA